MPHRGEVRAWRRPLYDITARRFLDPGHPLLADGEFKPMVGRASAVSSIATNRHAARRSSPTKLPWPRARAVRPAAAIGDGFCGCTT